MKRTWLYLLVALLIPAVLVATQVYPRYKCARNTSVWVKHLNMCVVPQSQPQHGYYLKPEAVCGSEEWDCVTIYRSTMTGEVLELPDYVTENLTPSSLPHALSPYLSQIVYVDFGETGLVVRAYDLRSKEDRPIHTFGPDVSGIYGFEWRNEDELSFEALTYTGEEVSRATRYSYALDAGAWVVSGVEDREVTEVECYPTYCEGL